jgi:hypothetical protein
MCVILTCTLGTPPCDDVQMAYPSLNLLAVLALSASSGNTDTAGSISSSATCGNICIQGSNFIEGGGCNTAAVVDCQPLFQRSIQGPIFKRGRVAIGTVVEEVKETGEPQRISSVLEGMQPPRSGKEEEQTPRRMRIYLAALLLTVTCWRRLTRKSLPRKLMLSLLCAISYAGALELHSQVCEIYWFANVEVLPIPR